MRCLLYATGLLGFIAVAMPAQEIVDTVTVRSGIQSCPPGRIVTGINPVTNTLLCSSPFIISTGPLITGEAVDGNPPTAWPPDTVTRAAFAYTGSAMHWCGPNRFITGLNLATNLFNCAGFEPGSTRNYTTVLGGLVLDVHANPTMRSGMRACPLGTALVGFHRSNDTLLCAGLPFCRDNFHCSSAARTCERQSFSGELTSLTGVCRATGTIRLLSDSACGGNSDGQLTDRSGNTVVLNAQPWDPWFDNDRAESMRLTAVRSGTIVKVFDNSSGSLNDDSLNVQVRSAGPSFCVATFEASQNNAALLAQYNSFGNNLDNEVSRVEVTSAMVANGMCADVNMNNNFVQTFGCHMGANQNWIYRVDGTIRGLNGLCLEAVQSEINAWPFLSSGQTRSAGVRIDTCSGTANQRWSVTTAGEIRMFGNMCLDIRGGGSASNTPLQIYPCHGGLNQRWSSSF